VHDRGSNGARGELATDGAVNSSDPVLVGVDDCGVVEATVVEVVVDDVDDVDDPGVVVEVVGAVVVGGTTPKSDPVTTATSAPAGTGSNARITAPVSERATLSASPSRLFESYSTRVSDSGPTGVTSVVETTE
jgi:hypothetical protein